MRLFIFGLAFVSYVLRLPGSDSFLNRVKAWAIDIEICMEKEKAA